jgi:hypothetical protein
VSRRALIQTVSIAGVLATAPAAAADVHIHAAFKARSYRPGQIAVLRIFDSPSRSLTLDLFDAVALRDRALTAAEVRPTWKITLHGRAPWTVYMRMGHWRSGVYLVRLATHRGVIGYATLVLRPLYLGSHRTLVVEPTNTWEAYNFWGGDSWYKNKLIWKVDLSRPYAGVGLPPHFAAYDLGFLRWVEANGATADFISDDDLDRFLSGKQLRRLYDLVVFPGHEEYVTGHVYDVVQSYRNRGGNLIYLSANSFFWRILHHGSTMIGRTRWDHLGRPESALVGAAYHGWESHLYKNHPYIVVGAHRLRWLFAGTGLENGDAFGNYGIEIDQRNKFSPTRTAVAARIANVFGRGHSAEMTYYRRGHAQVFDAGVLNFGGGVSAWPAAGTMLRNLWAHFGGRLPPAEPLVAAESGGESHLHGSAGAAVGAGLGQRDDALR